LFFKGRVTAANVLSDLYAMGVVDCDNMLMLLGVSTRLSEKERDVVIPLVIKGFQVVLYINLVHYFMFIYDVIYMGFIDWIGFFKFRTVDFEYIEYEPKLL